MIEFKIIRWKNFLSTGNQFNEIILNATKTTLISGINGSGKSTLLDALTFALFAKSYRGINKSQLINATNNKDCLVELEFVTNGKEYKIIRGIKPNVFEIWQDGQPLDQKNATDQQKFLEAVILKLNYKSFTQIAIIGSSKFIPFMQLQSSHRREVIEDLLDLTIFSSMNLVIKEKIKNIHTHITTLNSNIKNYEDQIAIKEKHISLIESQATELIEKNEASKKEYQASISELESQRIKILESIDELEDQKQDVTDKVKEYEFVQRQIDAKIKDIKKEVTFYDSTDVCPTCKRVITEDHKESICEELSIKNTQLEEGLTDLQNKLTSLYKIDQDHKAVLNKILELKSDLLTNQNETFRFQKNIDMLDKAINDIKNKFSNRTEEKEQLNDLKQKQEKTLNKIEQITKLQKEHNFVQSLLKDGGIKTNIINKYLPIINKVLNDYLVIFELYINFVLDSEFKETITTKTHQDYSYLSFSEGEKGRLDLSILFTWREIARYKNSANTNLLILDECFSGSLDATGKDILLHLIRFKMPNTNTFVIDHSLAGEDREKFCRCLEVSKTAQGFSKVTKA